MNKIIKNKIKLIIALLTFMIVILNAQIIYASDPDAIGSSETQSSSWQFNTNDYEPNSQISVGNASKLKRMGNTIVGVLQVIGTVSSVIVIAILGIKYMLGSVEERASYKSSMLPYLLGAFMVFGITNVVAIIVNLADVFNV